MWALPNIVSMNARAAAQAKNLKRAARRGPGKRRSCEVYGCEQHAVHSDLWYDIFSDDPKGVIHTCDSHSPGHVEGFFECEAFERAVIDHITWERYQVELGGKTLCLKCAAERYLYDFRHWIDPKLVQAAGFEKKNSLLFDTKTGFLNLGQCRHVLGVKQPLPAGVEFVDNAEFDGMDGHQISGDNLLEIIKRLDQPFCPVLDAAYQFAVSIGIYVRHGQQQEQAQKEAA
jgi:hypothetical protein